MTDTSTPVPGILGHTSFELIRPWMRCDEYARDGGHENPRIRIELAREAPKTIVDFCLGLEMPCVACGNLVRPFRKRRHWEDSVYYASTCPLPLNVGCARSKAAREEYARVEEALGTGWSDPRQRSLFP